MSGADGVNSLSSLIYVIGLTGVGVVDGLNSLSSVKSVGGVSGLGVWGAVSPLVCLALLCGLALCCLTLCCLALLGLCVRQLGLLRRVSPLRCLPYLGCLGCLGRSRLGLL